MALERTTVGSQVRNRVDGKLRRSRTKRGGCDVEECPIYLPFSGRAHGTIYKGPWFAVAEFWPGAHAPYKLSDLHTTFASRYVPHSSASLQDRLSFTVCLSGLASFFRPGFCTTMGTAPDTRYEV